MNMGDLNDFSRHVAEGLFAAFPELRGFACLDDNPKVTKGSLLIILPSVNPRAESKLIVTTDNGEISVIWDYWHEHVGFSIGTDIVEVETSAAIELLRNLFEERLVISIFLKGDKWIESTAGTPQKMIHDLEEDGGALLSGERKYVLSWRGTHDREVRGK